MGLSGKVPGETRASVVVCRYVSEFRAVVGCWGVEEREDGVRRKLGSAEAWSEAIAIFEPEASIPTVLAPSRARLWTYISSYSLGNT